MRYINHLKSLLVSAVCIIGLNPAFAITNGTFTVGPGGDFPDMAGAVSDLNGSTITGPVILNILPGTYSGSMWQFELTSISGASASNTVVIQAQNGAGTVTIDVEGTASANYVARLNNASFITMRNLWLINSATGGTGNGRVIDIAGSSSGNTIIGCTLTGATGSATSNKRAIVMMGVSGAPLTGGNNVVMNNTMQNGYCGVYMYGTSATTTTDDNIIDGNTITTPYVYGIYTYYAGSLTVSNNNISGTGTTFTHGMYFNYNQSGGEVSGNNITINTTSGTHYGVYNNYYNSTDQALPFNITGNTVDVTVSTGIAHSLYNAYCYNMHVYSNSFAANATGSGSSNPPTLMYYCNNSTAENNTFVASATTGGVAKGTYNFMSYANNCYVRANTFNINSTTGKICSEGYHFMYYAIGSNCNSNTFNYTSTTGGIFNQTSTSTPYNLMCYANNSSFDSNKVNFVSTTGVIGHGTTGTTSNFNSFNYAGVISYSHNKITMDSKFTGTSYGIYGYYAGYYAPESLTMSFDTFITNRASSATHYYFGYYLSYTGGPTATKTVKFNNNVIEANITGGTFMAMPYTVCYQSSYPEIKNNRINVITTNATVYASGYYPLYYTVKGGVFENNTFNVNASSSSSVYNPYYMLYYATNSSARNNTFTTNVVGGTIYNYSQGFGTGDTVENNTINSTTTSGSINNYFGYYTTGLTRNNTYNLNATSGTIYNRNYYGNGGMLSGNTINATTTTGTIYGTYEYNTSSSYAGLTFAGNKFNLKSNSGTIYGFYMAYYSYGLNMLNNIISTKTSGTSVLYNDTYGGNYKDVLLFNNVFHSNSTNASNNRLVYSNGGSSSYPGKTFLYNNIFSRSNAASGNAVEIKDTAYFKSDYNLLYSPGTVTVRSAVQNITTSDFSAWQQATGLDINSVFHDPGYMDAANLDFRPDPASVNSWALQGRGVHVPKDTADILGNPRAKDRFEGVPDIGAYEFTPTSIPENAQAVPATPAANSIQVFIYAGDTVCSIEWGNTVPASVNVKQYTGLQAAVTPGITERAYFYVDVQSPLGVYEYLPVIRYKDHWIGNISNETNTRIAKSSNGGQWAGYNYKNGVTDSVHNYLMPKDNFDSLSSKFTAVENARIGIRCIVPPMGLQHAGVTAFAATESWEPVFSPIGYQIIVDSVQSPLDLTKIQFTSVNTPPTYPITGLTENTTYYVNIRTICGLKDTSDWSTDAFRTMITCHAPKIYTTSVTDRQAVIFWDTIQTAISYEYTVDQSPNPPAFGTTILTNSTFAAGLDPGTTYYAHVRSHCGTIYDISGWGTYEFNTLWPAGVNDLKGTSGMTVYPNPAIDIINVNFANAPGSNAMVTITDIAGRIMLNESVKGNRTTINVSNLATGVYLLKYVDGSSAKTIKFNKE